MPKTHSIRVLSAGLRQHRHTTEGYEACNPTQKSIGLLHELAKPKSNAHVQGHLAVLLRHRLLKQLSGKRYHRWARVLKWLLLLCVSELIFCDLLMCEMALLKRKMPYTQFKPRNSAKWERLPWIST